MFAPKLNAMKNFYSIVAGLLITAVSFAQEKGNFEFGAGAGMSPFVKDGIVIFNVAGSADYYFSDRWSVKAKLAFDKKGWQLENKVDPSNENIVTANYITVPVMAGWHFGSTRKWYLNLGPYAAFLLDAKENNDDTDLTDGFETVDFGMAAAVGFKFPISDKLKFFVEYELVYGFVEVTDQWTGTTSTGRETLNVGLNFQL